MREKNNLSQVLSNRPNNPNKWLSQGLALETLKKFDVNLEKIKNEVSISTFEMIDYEEKAKSSVFGEKESICYSLHFETYNIKFEVKLLTFEYKAKSELLKLDIDCKTSSVKREIQYCCNSLQRRRNLNLMFITLILFARYLESRRLICNLIFQNALNIKVEENKDGGKIIVFSDEKMNIKLGVFWSIEYNSDNEVFDKIEVYYKVTDLANKNDIKIKLTQLVEPHLEFREKYHLWKAILKSLAEVDSRVLKKYGYNSDDISIIRHENSIMVKKENDALVKKEVCDDDGDNDEDMPLISSSPASCTEIKRNPLFCIKNSKMLSKHSREASILLSDNDDLDQLRNIEDISKIRSQNDKSDHIIYIDTLDDTNTPSTSTSRVSKPFSSLSPTPLVLNGTPTVHLSEYSSSAKEKNGQIPIHITTIEISELDTDSVIVLSPNTKDKGENDTRVCSSTRNTCSREVVGSGCVRNVFENVPDSTAETSNAAIELDFALPIKKPKIIDDDLEIIGVTYIVPD